MSQAGMRIVPVDETNVPLVAEVFRSVYGDDFPVGYVYDPEELLREIGADRLIPVLAVDANPA